MEEELLLKEKFNGLLESFKKGEQYVNEHPEDEKAKNRFNEIVNEMQNVFSAIPNATEEDFKNGFTIISTRIEEPKQEENKTQLKVIQPKQENILNTFSNSWEIAARISKSTIIPDNYKNKPENVIVAISLANQMQLDPFTVMQNLAIIKGKTSWSGSFCKTLIERTGKYKDLELNYVGKKNEDSYGCYLSATRVSDGKKIDGPLVDMKMAKAEGWTSNKKWLTLTDLMLAYRCQSFFCRLYVPEAMNGIYTEDEVVETTAQREQPADIL